MPTPATPPTAVVRPPSDSRGGAIVVEGSGWKPLTAVSFYFAPSDPSPFLQVRTDREGRYGLCFTLPNRSVGTYEWRVCQDCGTPAEVRVKVPFAVTSSPSIQPRDTRCPSPPAGPMAFIGELPLHSPTPSPQQTEPPTSSPKPSASPTEGRSVGSAAKQALELQTEDGFIAFNPVRLMRVAEPERIEVNIRRALAQQLTDEVKEQLSKGLSDAGKVEYDTLTVGDVMIVRLDENPNFTIDPISPTKQVLGDDVSTWMWDVTPTNAGRHSLILCVEVEIKLEGRDVAPQGSCRFEREIEVGVNPLYSTSSFMSRNWQWLIGGPIGTAALAWASRQTWLKRKKDLSGA
jgi:hypothetical protein